MKNHLKLIKSTVIIPVFCFCSLAQSLAQDSLGSVMDVYQRYMDSHRYFEVFLDSRRFAVPNDVRNSLELQTQLTFSSFLGKNRYYDALIEEWEQHIRTDDGLLRVVKDTPFRGKQAIEKIVESAKEKQVVMINENHFYPGHRLLAMDLLPRLKELGYTYFALETLYDGQDTVMNGSGSYPMLQTGYYTREQTFANLLRQAKRLGFRFVSYENSDSEKDREEGQAENLYRKTLGQDPSVKVFVLAGISHIMEKPDRQGKRWMATILKETYGVDPLTVSQTNLNIYRHRISDDYALVEGPRLADRQGFDAFDFLIVNNKSNPDLWDSKKEYHNVAGKEVQIALFHLVELDNLFNVEGRIPYFTTILRADERIEIPYNRSEGAYLVVYDGTGNAIEKRPLHQVVE